MITIVLHVLMIITSIFVLASAISVIFYVLALIFLEKRIENNKKEDK